MTVLRIAVVGAGARARAHLDAIVRMTDRYELVGVADANAARRRDAADRYGVPGFTVVDDLLDRSRPDVLVIAVPPDGHHTMTEAAAQRGIHVISEVPIATTMAMADAMIATAARHDVRLEIAENVWRWPIERLKQKIVAAGVIGRVTQAHLWYSSGSYHGLSAIRKLVPGTPTGVTGIADSVEGPPRADLLGRIVEHHPWELGIIDFSSGGRCIYQQPVHQARGNHWEIVGTRGYISGAEVVVETPDERRYPIERVTSGRALTAMRIATDPPVVWENPYQGYGLETDDEVALVDVLVQMHEAVRHDGTGLYGAAAARTDQEVLLALRESARLGSRRIDLPLTATTGIEDAIHQEYRQAYGSEPLGADLIGTEFPRQGINQYAVRPVPRNG